MCAKLAHPSIIIMTQTNSHVLTCFDMLSFTPSLAAHARTHARAHTHFKHFNFPHVQDSGQWSLLQPTCGHPGSVGRTGLAHRPGHSGRDGHLSGVLSSGVATADHLQKHAHMATVRRLMHVVLDTFIMCT